MTRGVSRRRILGSAAAAVAAVSFGTGCAGRKPQAAGSASGTGKTGPPRYGGQLTLAAKDNVNTFDPATQLASVKQVMDLTHDGLLGYKTGPGVGYYDRIPLPRLARQWETPDAQTASFQLNSGVKFANLPPVNGRTVTSADVKWTFEYMSRTGSLSQLPPAPATLEFNMLEQIETPDPVTAVLHLEYPFASLGNNIASEDGSILAHEIFDADGDFSKRDVGTGPWQLDNGASQPGVRFVFKKNPTYFVSGRPYIDGITWLVLPEDETQNAALLAKQLDGLDYTGLTTDTVSHIKQAQPDIVVYEYLEPDGGLVYMNCRKPPFNDARIRKAFALSIDRDELIKALASGKGKWGMAGSYPGLFTDAEVHQILGAPDPAAGRRLLADAGHPNGIDIELLSQGDYYGTAFVALTQLLQAQAKQGGINLAIKNLDNPTVSKRRRSGDFEMTIARRHVTGDLDSYLYGAFRSGQPDNFGGVNDPKIDDLVEAQRREFDPAKRKELWKEAIRSINQVPWALALFDSSGYALWYPSLKNYAPTGGPYGWPLWDSWLAK